MNPVIETLLGHRSIRRFTDEPVSDDNLTLIVKAAQAAPNWVNLQLVSIVAVENPEHRKKMSEYCGGQKQIAQAPVFLIFCADYNRVAIACKNYGQNLDAVLEDVDTVIVGAHETGIAIEAAVIAAESLGLGIVPIGDVRLHAQEMIEDLHLPKYVFPMLGLCIGHPAEDPGLKTRFPMSAVLSKEEYNSNLAGLIQAYDKEYADYLLHRPWNNRVGNWSELAADFYKTPFHYPGVAKALAHQGFLSVKDCK